MHRLSTVWIMVVVVAAVAALEGWTGAALHPRILRTVMAGMSRIAGYAVVAFADFCSFPSKRRERSPSEDRRDLKRR